jgi:Fe-S-cluster containining protein
MSTVVPPEVQAAFDDERRQTRKAALSDVVAMRACTVRMHARLAALQEQVTRSSDVHFDCKPGCAYCCHLRVEIRPHDAFVLAHHVSTRVEPALRERLTKRIEETRQQVMSLSRDEHVRAGIACALLVDGRCSVYEARPATCRKYHSVSVDTCRNAFHDTSAPLTGDIEHEQVRLAGNAVALGFAKGLEDAGFDANLYELHDAVHRALTDPRCERRWRRGKRAFV